MAKKIAIVNHKGGTAKTTTTYCLAYAKAKLGKTVLMIDMDPQFNLTTYTGASPDSPEYENLNSSRLFEGDINPLACCFTVEAIPKKLRLYLCPGTELLASKNVDLSSSDKKGLDYFLNNIKEMDPYFDYIFIDCLPGVSELMIAALLASDMAIIPSDPGLLSISGIDAIFRIVHTINNADAKLPHNRELKILGVVATRVKATKKHKMYLEEIQERYDMLGVIPESSLVTEDLEIGLPVNAKHASSAAGKAYMNLAEKM